MHEEDIINEAKKYFTQSPHARHDVWCHTNRSSVIVAKSDTSINLSLPVIGVNKEDINLSYSGGVLKIKVPRNKIRENWYVGWSGSETELFCTIDLKRHDLLHDLSQEFIAVLENGILTLSIPLTSTEKLFSWK